MNTPPDATVARWFDQAGWLDRARNGVRQALKIGRLPHALLIQGQPGLGKTLLSEWVAALVLCDAPTDEPCGQCASCILYRANTHPDLVRVTLAEDRKLVAVDDIRLMTTGLTLKSLRSGRKVAIVDPADALSTSGANALLKTLEEPPAGTLLILTAARPDRLPATIASRCQRIKILKPSLDDALAWLAQIDATADWRTALMLSAGAPLGAVRLQEQGVEGLAQEMVDLPAALSRPQTDVVALAERAQQHWPAERLRWLENWLTDRIRRGLQMAAPDHNSGNSTLPAALRAAHIRNLYTILDETRVAQSALRGSANVPLLFERVYLALGRELAGLRTARSRNV
jgi:DNA polymerase-3 subunit delta'